MKQFTALCIIAFWAGLVFAEDKPALKRAFVDGTGEGWRALTEEISKVWPEGVSAVDAIREQRDREWNR